MVSKPTDILIQRLVFKVLGELNSAPQWELLLRQARSAGVLSRLSFFWKKFGLFQPPPYFSRHLDSAESYWLSQKRIVDWELYNLQQVFQQLELPLILLKGTAYLAAGLNAGLGRVFSDVDILVPWQRLNEVKEALKWGGWFPETFDKYDQQYYERWMHELPPLRHVQRGTSLDVHHNILPLTCALHPNADLLMQAAVRIPNSEYWVLSPEDMILHSASHLFWGGEFENGLRDLSDIDLLLREFSDRDSQFWDRLIERANRLGLGEPLFYALRFTDKLLETPIPAAAITRAAAGRNRIMDFLFTEAIKPHHSSCETMFTGLARWLLYLRAHWLRMPWYLLLPHLSRKAWVRLTGKDRH